MRRQSTAHFYYYIFNQSIIYRAATQQSVLDALQKELMEESRKNERLLTERDSAENRARTLGNEVTDARRRIGDRDEKYGYLSRNSKYR